MLLVEVEVEMEMGILIILVETTAWEIIMEEMGIIMQEEVRIPIRHWEPEEEMQGRWDTLEDRDERGIQPIVQCRMQFRLLLR